MNHEQKNSPIIFEEFRLNDYYFFVFLSIVPSYHNHFEKPVTSVRSHNTSSFFHLYLTSGSSFFVYQVHVEKKGDNTAEPKMRVLVIMNIETFFER